MTKKLAEEAVQVFQIFIRATPEAIWTAITDRSWSARYGYKAPSDYDLKPRGKYRVVATKEMIAHGAAETLIDGEVLELDPPRKLVQTWRALFSPKTTAEGFTRLTYEIEKVQDGLSKLTITHELEGAPEVATFVSGSRKDAGGGWAWILSDLKTLLETGKALAA